jgi:nitrogen fixation protein FixH
MTQELKGWHVAAMFCTGFGIIIAVNLTLAYNAVATFPGLEVRNSYVASQQFDSKRQAQQALGWSVAASHAGDRLRLEITDSDGAPVRTATIEARVGRSTHVADDVTPKLSFDGVAYTAEVPLISGQWQVRLSARAADGTVFAQRIPLRVGG